MAHILVTGANGFIGSHLVRKLLELRDEERAKNVNEADKKWDREILCFVRHTSNLASLKGLDVKLIMGDFRDPESLVPAVKGASYIFHVGAELYVTCRQDFLDSNATGTENMLKAAATYAKDSLKRFVLVSSLAAAGPADGPVPITEEREFGQPVSWYAESKQKAENFAKQYSREIPITIVRPSGVYGPRDPAFAPAFSAARIGIRPAAGFGKHYAGIIFGPDLVDGFIKAADSDEAAGQTYFFTNDPKKDTGKDLGYTVNEIGKIMGKAAGKRFGITIPVPIFIMKLAAIFMELIYLITRRETTITRDKVRDLSQKYWLCSADKARRRLGWENKHTLLEGSEITNRYLLDEEKEIAEMASDSKSSRFLKYFCISALMGTAIEVLAHFGKVYHFIPWTLMFAVIIGLWGFVFGGIAMATRKKGFIVQFIPGFLILFGAELSNHFYIHQWAFYPNDIFGLAGLSPWCRAAWLGLATGFLIPIINSILKNLYKRKMRFG